MMLEDIIGSSPVRTASQESKKLEKALILNRIRAFLFV